MEFIVEMKKIKIRNGCYIINLDSKRVMIGTHWTAFYKKKIK